MWLRNLLHKEKISDLYSIFFFWEGGLPTTWMDKQPRVSHLSIAFLENIPSRIKSFDTACLFSPSEFGFTSTNPREASKYKPSSSEMQLSGLFREMDPLFMAPVLVLVALVLYNICDG